MEKFTIHTLSDNPLIDAEKILEYEAKMPPIWLDKRRINEIEFCDTYLYQVHPLGYFGGQFRDLNGIVGESDIKHEILTIIAPYIKYDVMREVNKLYSIIETKAKNNKIETDENEIQFRNGTYHFDSGIFTEERSICLNPLPLVYNPNAEKPLKWYAFLEELFHEDDIPCLQEYLGYMLVQHTRGQRMLIILGKGGEGKSVIKCVLNSILGDSLYSSSLHQLETDKFSVANLSGKLLMLDEDMEMNSLPSTNLIKSIVTAKYKMDLEKKNIQRFQGEMYCRLLCFSNGPLRALHDDSTGFYRRQLYIKVRPRRKDRFDDAYIGDQLAEEKEGILLWCLAGLERLKNNGWHFTVSERMEKLRQQIIEEQNNFIGFLDSSGYIEFERDAVSKTQHLHKVYEHWCNENAEKPQSLTAFGKYLHANQDELCIRYDKNLKNERDESYRGFHGIRIIPKTGEMMDT